MENVLALTIHFDDIIIDDIIIEFADLKAHKIKLKLQKKKCIKYKLKYTFFLSFSDNIVIKNKDINIVKILTNLDFFLINGKFNNWKFCKGPGQTFGTGAQNLMWGLCL
jgi:hypothetical protein